jgi:AraC-like DNA-binding protein
MQHLEVEPPNVLRDSIKDFWYIRPETDELHSTFEVTPDGYAEIVFCFGGECSVSTPDGWQVLRSPFLVELLQHPVQFRVANGVEIVGVKCFPWAVFELLGLHAGTGAVRHLDHPIAQVQATLATMIRTGGVSQAMADLAACFVQERARLSRGQLLGHAGEAMLVANGTLPVRQVAAAVHATVRTLERKFKLAAGHTVKGVSALMRFEQARRHLWLHPTANLAGVAQELGYADQSHLGREFKRFSGTTTATFARKAARWQRTNGTDVVAFVLA